MRQVGPRPETARARYDDSAGRYDVVTRVLARPRRLAVERLALQPGETVIDVACGTGLNFEALRRGVGSEGRVVGIDISAGMLAVARERIDGQGWQNVELPRAT